MCVVSMVTEHYRVRYPSPYIVPKTEYDNLLELIRKAKEYDRIMGQADCPDTEKEDWLKEVIRSHDPVTPVWAWPTIIK